MNRQKLIEALRIADETARGGGPGAAQAASDAKRLLAVLKGTAEENAAQAPSGPSESQNDALSALATFTDGMTMSASPHLHGGLEALIGPGIDAVVDGAVGSGGMELTDSAAQALNQVPEQGPSFSERIGQYLNNFGDRYDQGLAASRGVLDTAYAEDPGIALTSGITGGLATGGVGGARAVAGRAFLPGMARLSATGAGMGALDGAIGSRGDPLRTVTKGDYENVVDELAQMSQDTAGGALVGSVAAPLIGVGATAFKKAAGFFAGYLPGSRKLLLSDRARNDIMEAYQADIESGRITPEQAMRELKDNPDMMIGDLGPNLREKAREIAQTPSMGGTELVMNLKGRNREQFARAYPQIARMMTGQDNPNFDRIFDDAVGRKIAAGKEVYGAIDDLPAVITPRMRQIIKNPQMKSVVKRMNAIRQANEMPAIRAKKALDGEIDISTLRSVLMSADDQISRLYSGASKKSGMKNYARSMSNLVREFREEAYASNPDLADAQAVYKDLHEIETAIEAGRAVFRDGSERVGNWMQGDAMSDAAKTAYRIGAMESLRNAMKKKSWDSNMFRAIYNSDEHKDLLQNIFHTPADFDKFGKIFAAENKMFETFKAATGNSDTAKKLAMLHSDSALSEIVEQAGYSAGLGGQSSNAGLLRSLGPRASAFLAKQGMDVIIPPAGRQDYARNYATERAKWLQGRDINALAQPGNLPGLLAPGVPHSGGALGGSAAVSQNELESAGLL